MDPITIAALAGAAANVIGATRPAAQSLPTSASTIFGSNMFANDSSGWLVNFGDAATQSQSMGPKTGPSQSTSATPVNTAPGGQSNVVPANALSGANGAGGALPGTVGGIPTVYLYLAGGALLLILLLKKRG